MRNQNLYKKIKNNWDAIVKPLDSMGRFEGTTARLGAVLDDETIDIKKAALVIFCADNGVIAEGISQSDESVTASVLDMMGQNKSSVCHLAKCAGIDVFPVDMGVRIRAERPGVDQSFFIAAGTKNFAEEPAMTEEECVKAIDAGRKYAKKMICDGYKLILLGEMGIGNTTTSAAVISAIMEKNASLICGRGSGLSDKGLEKKINVINQAITKYKLSPDNVIKILSCVGGFDIAAMVGVILEASNENLPVILDGVITAAAALAAVMLEPECNDIVFFSHKGRESGILCVAEYLGQKPVIDADLALGEGTGGVLFYQLLQSVIYFYNNGTKFADTAIEQYRRFQ